MPLAHPRGANSPLARRLRSELEGEVRFDRLTRGIYATDASFYQIEPMGVVIPRTVEDIVRAVEIAGEEEVSIMCSRWRYGRRKKRGRPLERERPRFAVAMLLDGFRR